MRKGPVGYSSLGIDDQGGNNRGCECDRKRDRKHNDGEKHPPLAHYERGKAGWNSGKARHPEKSDESLNIRSMNADAL